MEASGMPSSVCVGNLARPELLEALQEKGIELNQAARDLFCDERFIPSVEAKRFRILALTVSDLGFPAGAVYPQIAKRALELGLAECPLELGAYLRMQFLNQAEPVSENAHVKGKAPNNAFTIASKPLDDTDETPKGFYLRRSQGAFWLRGYWSDYEHIWSSEDVWVFSKGEGKV